MDDYHKTLNALIEFIELKQGENIQVIDVSELTAIANFIIIITANSTTHASSLTQHIIDFMHENKMSDLLVNKNVNTSNPWILIDCSDILVNIFQAETREYYKLENLYVKGKTIYRSGKV